MAWFKSYYCVVQKFTPCGSKVYTLWFKSYYCVVQKFTPCGSKVYTLWFIKLQWFIMYNDMVQKLLLWFKSLHLVVQKLLLCGSKVYNLWFKTLHIKYGHIQPQNQRLSYHTKISIDGKHNVQTPLQPNHEKKSNQNTEEQHHPNFASLSKHNQLIKIAD